MFEPKTLQTNFKNLIGVRQPDDPTIPQLPSSLTTSNSGIFVEDKNPLATTDNMWYSSPNFNPSVYPQWVSGSNYAISTPIYDLGILYISLSALTNDTIHPASDTNNWVIWNPFVDWIQRKINQGISNLFLEVARRKKLLNMGKAILERQQLYRGGGSIYDKIIPEGRFLGFTLDIEQAEGLWVYIDQIGIQLTDAQTSMRFYLYHTDFDQPVGVWEINIAYGNSFVWTDLNESIPFQSGLDWSIGQITLYLDIYYEANATFTGYSGDPSTDTTNWTEVSKPAENCILKYLSQNTSGSYIFGYYEDDLSSGNRALSKTWNCAVAPCIGCSGIDISWYNQWSRYTTFRNIQVPSIGLNEDRSLFDLRYMTWGSLTNWGLNFSLTVRCNLTDFVSKQKFLFSDALAMQICKEFLEAIAKGVRIGPNPQQTKLSAIADLDRKAPAAWILEYDKAIEALNLDLSGFSNACMPCEDENSGKFFSI